jgi:5-methyltetrahydropteroyltriglutamate--homocysteine methyltransferase
MPNPFRTDHVGSLLRPPALRQARAAYAAGRLEREALRQVEDAAILDALERQRQVGLDVFTDGEYRREFFLSPLLDAVEGIEAAPAGLVWHGPAAPTQPVHGRVVAARLKQVRRLAAHEAGFLLQHAPGLAKITLPSPMMFLLPSLTCYHPGTSDRYYPTQADLLQDLVQIIHGEVQALVAEGARYVQLDAPTYPHFVDARLRERARLAGVDPDAAVDEAIAADNACLAGVDRAAVTLAIHLCRGNSRSRWLAEGGYEPVAERVFGVLDVDRFLLEYDSERAGGFEPLRFVPKGKTVVLGLITTKSGALEAQDAVLRRIDEAARYVPLESLALSPQCGFATNEQGNLLSADEQWRKLELVVDTARKVWG